MHNKIPAALIDRSATEAPWLNLAFAEVGVTEYHGLAANNPRILEYISSFPNLEHIKRMVKDPKTKVVRRRRLTGPERTRRPIHLLVQS